MAASTDANGSSSSSRSGSRTSARARLTRCASPLEIWRAGRRRRWPTPRRSSHSVTRSSTSPEETPRKRKPGGDVREHRRVEEQWVGQDEADAPTVGELVTGRDRRSPERQAPARQRDEAGQGQEERALPGAVRADHGQRLAVGDGQVLDRQDRPGATNHDEVADLDEGRRRAGVRVRVAHGPGHGLLALRTALLGPRQHAVDEERQGQQDDAERDGLDRTRRG